MVASLTVPPLRGLVLPIALFACTPSTPVVTPTDAHDVVVTIDAGESLDVGTPVDAGDPVDAGGVIDAGGPVDAGTITCDSKTPADPVDPWSMRLASAGFGGITELTAGAHHDVFLESPTQYIRIGARLDWGATIVFFGLHADAASNVIDANDTGRELQVALYDGQRILQGCAHDASCTGANGCGGSITFLGWNPVQGGDECNHGAPVLGWTRAGDALRLDVRPLQWNPDWDAPDCRKSACTANGRPVDVRYRTELRFVSEHVVEITNEVTSEEAFDHSPTGQEWPTMYVAHGQGGPDLPVLLDAAGTAITIETPANDGFRVGNATSPAPWVAFQDSARAYGVGLWMDQGVRAFQGWRGDGTVAPYFHNVRASLAFGLKAGATVRGISYVALGNFDTIGAEFNRLRAKRAPFGVLDAPAAGSRVGRDANGRVQVSGWALDDGAVTVRVEVDGATVATLDADIPRSDVCEVYPAWSSCPDVGYAAAIEIPESPCSRLLRVIARDGDGNEQMLGEAVIDP